MWTVIIPSEEAMIGSAASPSHHVTSYGRSLSIVVDNKRHNEKNHLKVIFLLEPFKIFSSYILFELFFKISNLTNNSMKYN